MQKYVLTFICLTMIHIHLSTSNSDLTVHYSTLADAPLTQEDRVSITAIDNLLIETFRQDPIRSRHCALCTDGVRRVFTLNNDKRTYRATKAPIMGSANYSSIIVGQDLQDLVTTAISNHKNVKNRVFYIS